MVLRVCFHPESSERTRKACVYVSCAFVCVLHTILMLHREGQTAVQGMWLWKVTGFCPRKTLCCWEPLSFSVGEPGPGTGTAVDVIM